MRAEERASEDGEARKEEKRRKGRTCWRRAAAADVGFAEPVDDDELLFGRVTLLWKTLLSVVVVFTLVVVVVVVEDEARSLRGTRA